MLNSPTHISEGHRMTLRSQVVGEGYEVRGKPGRQGESGEDKGRKRGINEG